MMATWTSFHDINIDCRDSSYANRARYVRLLEEKKEKKNKKG